MMYRALREGMKARFTGKARRNGENLRPKTGDISTVDQQLLFAEQQSDAEF
jgi:hypothetical protein